MEPCGSLKAATVSGSAQFLKKSHDGDPAHAQTAPSAPKTFPPKPWTVGPNSLVRELPFTHVQGQTPLSSPEIGFGEPWEKPWLWYPCKGVSSRRPPSLGPLFSAIT